jgi:hypothetical protein
MAGPDECWVWTGGKFDFGYGACWDGDRTTQAHRVSWVLAHGHLPPKTCVLHKCDNPPCVNPAHLFLGSRSDNTADMIRKGRAKLTGPITPATGDRNGSRTSPESRPKGSAVKTSKLTLAQVLEIRRLRADGLERNAVAAQFGIAPGHVSQITSGRAWRHSMPGSETPEPPAPHEPGRPDTPEAAA